MKIYENVRMILVTFILPRSHYVPETVMSMEEETQDSLDQRRSKHVAGEVVIERTEKCTVQFFLEELGRAGFEMFRITHQFMADRRQKIKIEFVPSGDGKQDRRSQSLRGIITKWLEGLCGEAFWATAVYLNPMIRKGKPDPADQMLSVVFDGRLPLFSLGGQPIVEWKKDGHGQRIGNGPVPTMADYRLEIVGDTIQLVDLTELVMV